MIPNDAMETKTIPDIPPIVVPPGKCELMIDHREKLVTQYKEEMSQINHTMTMLTTGDYCVLSPRGKILAIIERKTYNDFSASFKDGRSENVNKLIKLREQTGCTIMFIIEGKEFPDPQTLFANIPYRNIESSIFHMMIGDGIVFHKTQDALGTARMLIRFMNSMNTMLTSRKSVGYPNNILGTEGNSDLIIEGGSEVTPPENNRSAAIDMLTKSQKKTVIDVVRDMWNCFKGITVTSSESYLAKWSIKQIVCHEVTREEIYGLKLATGRKITKLTADGLVTILPTIERKLLGEIPGISSETAAMILSTRSLADLLRMTADEMSILNCVGKTQKSLGLLKANSIIEHFNFKRS